MNINEQNFHCVGLPQSSKISGYATAHVSASITRRAVDETIHFRAVTTGPVGQVFTGPLFLNSNSFIQ